MKKIKEFAEKDRLQQPLLVKECKNGTTSKGAPYLNLVLQDSSGTIDGKFWDVKPQDAEKVHVPEELAWGLAFPEATRAGP